jgi:hypothetical protein
MYNKHGICRLRSNTKNDKSITKDMTLIFRNLDDKINHDMNIYYGDKGKSLIPQTIRKKLEVKEKLILYHQSYQLIEDIYQETWKLFEKFIDYQELFGNYFSISKKDNLTQEKVLFLNGKQLKQEYEIDLVKINVEEFISMYYIGTIKKTVKGNQLSLDNKNLFLLDPKYNIKFIKSKTLIPPEHSAAYNGISSDFKDENNLYTIAWIKNLENFLSEHTYNKLVEKMVSMFLLCPLQFSP